jgi:hypothetical protein
MEVNVISNLREYRISKAQAKRFQDALEHFDLHPPEGDPILVRAQRDSLASQTATNLVSISNHSRHCQHV